MRACDVTVVGGGLAGLTLAVALGSVGMSVICVDREPTASSSEKPDTRTTALALGSKRVLDTLGVWPFFKAHAAQPILDIRVADRYSPLFVHYDHRDAGNEPFGWVVDNRYLKAALLKRVAQLPSLTHLTATGVTALDTGPVHTTLTLSDGQTMRCSLAAGADGRNSFCRKTAGIGTWGWTYDQMAIVCNIRHEKPHHAIALEHFFPSGPFAVLPLTGNRSSIVWTEHKNRAPLFLQMSESDFNRELQQRAGDWLGEISLDGPRHVWPVSLQHARSYTVPRLALVGEAAHAIHPIAGQGLNMGLRDVAVLAEVAVDAWRLGLDPGSPLVLQQFQQRRRPDNMLLVSATDGLNRLFSNGSGPLHRIRSTGLAAVNRLRPVRQLFMRHAMGTLGDLPRLVKGESL
ncbi:MAG: UbiH/UbiF/VisC/COQ6 family ubiquinone biosynthesis hydroxylase [Pseudomonadota bacterium]|nr:UbiH/UbiF/VisC/COQ6 family ubiquinone biosynthesis hydroxylase [Pseudomonadota bacterium]